MLLYEITISISCDIMENGTFRKVQGTYTALVTPFRQDQSLDLKGLKQNVDYQLSKGISGLLALGTTAETPTLEAEEMRHIIELVVNVAGGRVPVMVGTGSNSTAHTVNNTNLAESLGANIALVVTPYYNKPSQEGIYQHFRSVSANSGIPIMVYNIQGRTGVNIETSTLERIAELHNIIGVKEASGNIGQMDEVIQRIALQRENFSVMCGDDALTLPLLSLGGQGVISVVSNLLPGHVSDMVNSALRKDYDNARDQHRYLSPMFKAAFIEGNPVSIKYAMQQYGMAAGPVRQPLYGLSKRSKQTINKVLKRMNLGKQVLIS